MRLDAIQNRRIVLGIIVTALVPAFAFTQVVVNRYKQQRQDLADEWSARGASDLASHPAAAVADFETALSFTPANTRDRFQLAEALIHSNRFAEARAQLLTLWSQEPGNGEVNLELARLAGNANDVNDAIRYYHAAVDGAWESGAASARREARLELARLLMRTGQNTRAQAELIAMIDDLPNDPALIANVGALLVDAGADGRARTLFERALNVDPTYRRADRLLGALEYRAGNYGLAHEHLRSAAQAETLEPSEQQMLEVSGQVLSLDPGARRLTTRERARRVLANLDTARSRLEQCSVASTTDAATIAHVSEVSQRMNAAGRLEDRDLLRDPDLIDQTMDLVFDVELLPPSLCGQPSNDDRALQILAGQRRSQTR